MPSHTPCVPVSVMPRCAVPAIVGAVVLLGAEASTVAVGALGTVSVPSGFVAVTSTRTCAPSSAVVSV